MSLDERGFGLFCKMQMGNSEPLFTSDRLAEEGGMLTTWSSSQMPAICSKGNDTFVFDERSFNRVDSSEDD